MIPAHGESSLEAIRNSSTSRINETHKQAGRITSGMPVSVPKTNNQAEMKYLDVQEVRCYFSSMNGRKIAHDHE